jgi:hypothetical protein
MVGKWETRCSATLVSSDRLVTAAHCADENISHVSCLNSVLGEPATYEIQGFNFIPYWDQTPEEEGKEDIAVLYLQKPIEGAPTAALPTKEYLTDLYYAGEDWQGSKSGSDYWLSNSQLTTYQ